MFTVVAFGLLSLLMFGWRLLRVAYHQARGDAGDRVTRSSRSSRRRLQGFGTTIFAEMSALAASTGAINLGQGFPDTDGPQEVADAAVAAIRAGHNQYPPGTGDPRAACRDRRRISSTGTGSRYDPDTEVLVDRGRHRGDRGHAARACASPVTKS